MTSHVPAVEEPGCIEMITFGSPSELAMIAGWPLPWIPAQWIRMRFRGGERWSAHSRRIMSHPTYLAGKPQGESSMAGKRGTDEGVVV